MRTWSVGVDNGSFDSAGITKDCQAAICEYIWNGFEADATQVSVSIHGGDMKEAAEIQIADNGQGINHEDLPNTFGAFLSSKKRKNGIRIKSQSNKGKGRFSYTAIASIAKWETIYQDENGLHKYSIQLDACDKASITESDVEDATAPDSVTGTTVTIPIACAQTLELISSEKMHALLLEEFSWYLYLNKESGASLTYLGSVVDYNEYINVNLSNRQTVVIDGHEFTIDVIVWKNHIANSSKIYYVDQEGNITNTENTSFNNNTVGFCHGVYVHSQYFSELPTLTNSDDETFVEYEAGQKKTMRSLKKQIRELLSATMHRFLLTRADTYLEELERKSELPAFPDDDFGQCRKKDFVKVTREIYCVEPKIFHNLKPAQSKSLLGFLALLLDSNERENILSVVEQVVSLTHEQRAKFVEVLKRTKLEHVVNMVEVIQKRYEVVRTLKEIVYNPDVSRFANERDHIQKIIERHFWLFGDQYSMVTADVTFKRSLKQFEELLEIDKAEVEMLTPEELRQRMDIFLYGGRMNEVGVKEGLVVELKAPSVTLSQVVLSQIERYANMIRKEPQFSGNNRTWRFFAICSSIDDVVKSKYDGYKSHGKFGLVSMIGNFEIYALTWDDIFLSFENRYKFLLDKIQADYEETANDDSISAPGRQYVSEKVKRIIEMNPVH